MSKRSDSKDKSGRVCVGGTFDIFHEGHRRLLRKVVEVARGNGVLIGITSDEFASEFRERKIHSFEQRSEAVSEFLEELGCDFVIVKLHNFHGPAATDPSITGIVVSPDTLENAERINRMRRKNSLAPLKVIEIEMVYGEDGEPVSSSGLAEKMRNRSRPS